MCHNAKMATEARDIQKRVLPNGLVVLTETMSHVRSVSVGIWIRNGSRREVQEENGLAHFMEHMVFKGTRNRTAGAAGCCTPDDRPEAAAQQRAVQQPAAGRNGPDPRARRHGR